MLSEPFIIFFPHPYLCTDVMIQNINFFVIHLVTKFVIITSTPCYFFKIRYVTVVLAIVHNSSFVYINHSQYINNILYFLIKLHGVFLWKGICCFVIS